MKILLAYQSGATNRNDPYINLLPTGLTYIHASLKDAGYDSLLANFSAWSTNRIKQELCRLKPDIIGISLWTHNRHTSIELARLCRATIPNSIIIVGGAHATFCFQDFLSESSPVDIVVIGEGEVTFLELVRTIQYGTEWQNIPGIAFYRNNLLTTTSQRKNLENLDTLIIPSKYLEHSIGVDLQLQSEFIVTTRGCPSTCYFCSSPDFWGKKVRFRSPQAIIDEIIYIRQKFGLIYFSIRDDTFTADRKRVLEFCRLLTSQNLNILWNCQSRVTAIDEELVLLMKQAGCECIQLGVESGSPNILKQLGKNITTSEIKRACHIISEIGINLSVFLITNVPGETEENIKQSLELIRQIHPDDGYVSPLAYYPGTKLYRDALTAGNTTADIFQNQKKDALYVADVMSDSSNRILKEITKSQLKSPDRFNLQKERYGACTTTNVIAGEWFRREGSFDKALKEFKEITEQTPDNPWGWFLLGDLYSEMGRIKKGAECYRKVLNILPNHKPSRMALKN